MVAPLLMLSAHMPTQVAGNSTARTPAQEPAADLSAAAHPSAPDARAQAQKENSKSSLQSSVNRLPHGPQIREAQELLLDAVRDEYLKSIRNHYLNKSDRCKNESDVMRIALDGIQGVATNEAIHAAREKLGLSKDGGLDQELLKALKEHRGEHHGRGPGASKGAEAEARETQEKAKEIGSLIDHERSPAEAARIIRGVRQTRGEAGVSSLMEEFKARHSGRSIVEEMVKEKDLSAPEIADFVVELENGKANKEAAELAVRTSRLLYEDGRLGRHGERDREAVRGMLEQYIDKGGKTEDVSRIIIDHMGVRHAEKAAAELGEKDSKNPSKFFSWLMREERFLAQQSHAIGTLIDKEKPPTAVSTILARVDKLCGKDGLNRLEEIFKADHDGRSIVQEMAKERDLKVTDIANFVAEAYPHKYETSAVVSAIQKFRSARKTQMAEIRNGLDNEETMFAKDLLSGK